MFCTTKSKGLPLTSRMSWCWKLRILFLGCSNPRDSKELKNYFKEGRRVVIASIEIVSDQLCWTTSERGQGWREAIIMLGSSHKSLHRIGNPSELQQTLFEMRNILAKQTPVLNEQEATTGRLSWISDSIDQSPPTIWGAVWRSVIRPTWLFSCYEFLITARH